MEDQNNPTTNTNDQPESGATSDSSITPASQMPEMSPEPTETSAPSGTQDTGPKIHEPFAGHAPKKSGKKILMIVLVLLLVGGAAAFFIMSGKDKDSATTQNAVKETKEIEVLRIGTTDGPTNNLFPKEGIGISYTMNRQVYEGLVATKDGKYVPLLATSWSNPDEKTWLFKLKPNVKFHSGKAFTATDVKRSFEALEKIDFLGYITSTIDKVEVVSDLEVRITTTEPDALLLNRLAIAFITDQDVKGAEGNNGTGPYTLDKTAKYSETTATLIANDSYHQGRPKTRKLVYLVYTKDSDMNKAIKDNKIDMMDTIPSSEAIAGLDAAGLAKIEYAAPGTFGMYMNMLREDSPLQNKEVRKALAQALNRQGLVDELDNNNLPATQVVPKSLPGHDASITFPEFNAAAAKETLAKAGYPNGVTLEYVYVKEVQPDPPILIKQLEAAGFKIKDAGFSEVDPALDLVFGGKFDLFSAAYTSDLADSRDLLGALLESTEQSYPVYKDAAFDKLLEDSDRELDPTKRIAILQQANKYIADNLLWIPLRSTAYVSYFKADFDVAQDFNGGGSLGVYFWKVGEKTTD